MRISSLGLLLLLTSATHLHAARYFVDYSQGGDDNSGTNRQLAWKHCPGDPSATGLAATKTLTAGDTVFFKGGETYVLTGATGIVLNWDGAAGNAITYDGNSNGTWGAGRARFTDNHGDKSIAAFSATILRRHLAFEFLNIGGMGGAAALPGDLGYPLAPRPGGGIVFRGGAEDVSINSCVFHDIGFWFNQKPMNAASLAGAGFSSTKCRDVTISNCDFSRMAVACDLAQATELSDLQIANCSFGASILWPIDLPPWVGSVQSSAVALDDSSFADDRYFQSGTWAGYGADPRTETVAVEVGTVVTFSAVAIASQTATFQWQKNFANIASATGAELRLGAVTAADSAIYSVVATNAAGTATSNTVALVVGGSAPPPPSSGTNQTAPTILVQPVGQTVAAGSTVMFTGVASGTPAPSYQWRKNGLAIGGWTAATLTMEGISSNDIASYSVVATNAAGTATSNTVALSVSSTSQIPAATAPSSSLLPRILLFRVTVDTPMSALDFVVEGSVPKQILIRAAGPTLRAFAVTDFLANPVIELFQGPVKLLRNDAWAGDAAIAVAVSRLGMFPFASAASKDAALLVTLSPGTYRVNTTSADASGGQLLIEIRELP